MNKFHDIDDPYDWRPGDVLLYLENSNSVLTSGALYTMTDISHLSRMTHMPLDEPTVSLVGVGDITDGWYWWRFVNISKKMRRQGMPLIGQGYVVTTKAPEPSKEGRVIDTD